jgi:hypothetical protein
VVPANASILARASASDRFSARSGTQPNGSRNATDRCNTPHRRDNLLALFAGIDGDHQRLAGEFCWIGRIICSPKGSTADITITNETREEQPPAAH